MGRVQHDPAAALGLPTCPSAPKAPADSIDRGFLTPSTSSSPAPDARVRDPTLAGALARPRPAARRAQDPAGVFVASTDADNGVRRRPAASRAGSSFGGRCSDLPRRDAGARLGRSASASRRHSWKRPSFAARVAAALCVALGGWPITGRCRVARPRTSCVVAVARLLLAPDELDVCSVADDAAAVERHQPRRPTRPRLPTRPGDAATLTAPACRPPGCGSSQGTRSGCDAVCG
jgi:hypothetical protein